MENLNKKSMFSPTGKIWAGLFIILIGLVMLLDNLGLYFPSWIISWNTILMAIGFFVGSKNNFKGSAWLVIVLIGLYFTLDDIFDDFGLSNVVFPVMLMAIGIYLITKPKSINSSGSFKHQPKTYTVNENGETVIENDPITDFEHKQAGDANDYINSVNVFGGSNQVIYSKNLKGGEITAVFGGGDVNLTHADFEGEVILDVTAVFGGVKIILPANWHTKSEVTAIFGGVDDKRAIFPPVEGQPKKLLIIRGVVMFGGVEFKSY